MKKLKLCLLYLLTVFISFCGITLVNAEVEETFTLVTYNRKFWFDTQTNVVKSYETGTFPLNLINYKYSMENGNSYISVIGKNGNDLIETSKCNYVKKNDNESLALAYIIHSITGQDGGIHNMEKNTDKYYWLEFAISKYLDNNDTRIQNSTLNEQIKEISMDNKDLDTIIKEAKEYSKDAGLVLKDSTTGLEVTELKFTLDNNVYKSQKVYVSGPSNTVHLPSIKSSNDDFKVNYYIDDQGYYFYVEVDKDKISSTNRNVTVEITANKKNYYANYYDCNEDKKHDLISTATNSITKTVSASISGSIELPKLTITAVDSKGENLSETKVKVENKDKTYSEEITIKAGSYFKEGIPYGEYTITQLSTSDGYVKLQKPITVKVSEKDPHQIVEIVNNPTRVEISRIDAANGNLLSGAKLQIQDDKQNVLYEWTTEEKVHVIEGIKHGTYYLVEVNVPSGYDLYKKNIEFVVNDEKEVVKVEMGNNVTLTKISNVSSKDGKELAGATLEIQDKSGNIVKYCTDTKGNKNSECKWVSTDKPYEIEGLPVGTYYLVETVAAKGYELNKEKIKFQVNGDSSVTQVKMENVEIVKVPNTLSSRSSLLLALAMLNIALGIGIVTYVKKNKVKE